MLEIYWEYGQPETTDLNTVEYQIQKPSRDQRLNLFEGLSKKKEIQKIKTENLKKFSNFITNC